MKSAKSGNGPAIKMIDPVLRPEKLRAIVNEIPFTSGVYLMKADSGEILYIGKAKSLRARVRSYFNAGPAMPKITILMSKVDAIDYIETSTEVDALLLEARLVRKYQPRYNKELKDDKSYPLLKITGDKFPRLVVTRNKSDSKATYYGPFTDVKLLRQAIALINTLFPVRKCRTLPKTACLYYHIGQCLAPCIKPEIQPEYDKTTQEVKAFIGSGKRSFMEYLSESMMRAAAEYRYEDAQFYKEQIQALGRLKNKKFKRNQPEAGIVLAATLGLKKFLGLERLPEKIVCFDVSNNQGEAAVASRVGFYRELPDKLVYRRYKIKTVKGIDDYAMIQEAVRRMIRGIQEGREDFVPDVIMIDGGKGHLNAARQVMTEEDYTDCRLISLAKKFETVYCHNDKGEVIALPLKKDHPALHLLQKIRDEAHRFAVTYHRTLKTKQLSRSALDDIPGIGNKLKKILFEQFESIDELKRTGAEQIAGLPGMNRKTARVVWDHFQKG